MATVMAAHNPMASQAGCSPKRPRLSLQTNISLNLARSRGGAPFSSCHHDYSSNAAAAATPITSSPTRINTLSNIIAPLTAINTRVSRLRLDTSSASSASSASAPSPTILAPKRIRLSLKTAPTQPHTTTATTTTAAAVTTSLPDTPASAFPFSPQEEAEARPGTGRGRRTEQPAQYHLAVPFAFDRTSSHIVTTPPLPAEWSDAQGTPNFKFGVDSQVAMPTEAAISAPYTHPRSLRSILRNSPHAPPRSAFDSQDHSTRGCRPVKRVCYNTPLTQTITNNKYTVSHIDLLIADDIGASVSSSLSSDESDDIHMMSYTPDETRDGGSTPGPWADMQRRIACLATATTTTTTTTTANSLRKRKRKEKTRRWVWTIGVEEEEEEDETKIGGAIAALRAAERMDELGTPVMAATPPPLDSHLDSGSSSPTPTPSMTSSISADDDDDDDDDDGSMDLDHQGRMYEMNPDTPRAAMPALVPLRTPASFSVSPAAPTGSRPALSLLVPAKLDASKLCPGAWNQPDSPLQRDGGFAMEP